MLHNVNLNTRLFIQLPQEFKYLEILSLLMVIGTQKQHPLLNLQSATYLLNRIKLCPNELEQHYPHGWLGHGHYSLCNNLINYPTLLCTLINLVSNMMDPLYLNPKHPTLNYLVCKHRWSHMLE